MSIAVNYLGRFSSTGGHGAGPFTTASMAPDPNSVLVAIVAAVGATNSENIVANLSLADSLSHVWTERASGHVDAWESGVKIFTAPNTPTTSFTLTADCGADNIHAYFIDVFSCTGQHATPTGATAAANDQAGDGAVSTTLSGAPATTSVVIAAMVNMLSASGFTGILHGTGWTEIADSAEDQWIALQSQTRTESTSTTVGWDDAYQGVGSSVGSGLVAVEIVAAAAVVPPFVTTVDVRRI